jgi:hypothetical protein
MNNFIEVLRELNETKGPADTRKSREGLDEGLHSKNFREISKTLKGDYDEYSHSTDVGKAGSDHDHVLGIVKKNYPEIHRGVAGHLKKALSSAGKATKYYLNDDDKFEQHHEDMRNHEDDALHLIKNHIKGK